MIRRGKHAALRPKGRQTRRFGRAVPLALALTLVLTAVAWAADQPDFGGDNVDGTNLDFGAVCPSDSPVENVQVHIRQQNSNPMNNYADGSLVVITREAITQGAVGTLSAPDAVGTITLPANWNTDRSDKISSAVTSAVTLSVPADAAAGSYSGSIQYRGTGPLAGSTTGETNIRNRNLSIAWEVLEETNPACVQAAYELDGFYQPVENAVVNGAKAGRTIPLKFNILDADGLKQEDPSLVDVFIMKTACNNGAEHSLLEDATLSSGKTELRWDADGEQMIFNWKTPKTPGCYRIVLEVPGDSLSVNFDLK